MKSSSVFCHTFKAPLHDVALNLIDTHAHLDDEKFQADLTAVLARARQAGVERVVTIGTTAASSARALQLAGSHMMLAATVGIQPNNIAACQSIDWDSIAEQANNPLVVGIGETGLDRHWDDTPFPQQEDYFTRHLQLARAKSLPVVIHCREAEADVVRMLRQEYDRMGPIKGVMHSFTGDQATCQECLEMGLYISFAGMVTYKSGQNLLKVARDVPLDRLLVETDSPYLAPVPMRGKRNEPAFVVHTLEMLALARCMEAAGLAETTTQNARLLFSLT
jgi:TatD DNase family protein